MKDGHEDTYDPVFDRVFRRIVEREGEICQQQSAAGQLLDELMAQTLPARRLLLAGNSPRFQNLFLCELLIGKAREAAFQDADQSLDLAHLAVAIAESLHPASCGGREVREGLWCRASAQLANALRVSGRHVEAELVFRPVEALIREEGRIGLQDLARVLDLRASLHRERRQFEHAAHLLDRVVEIYQKLGTWNLLGRALMQRSAICGEVGDLEGEIRMLRRALDLLDPNEEPRSFLVARHNLIYALNQSGRSREAFALLFHTRPLYFKTGDRLSLLRLRWLEGLVAVGLGRLEQAEVAFREVRDAYVQLALDWDAALVSLELAGVYVCQGRTADVLQLAEEMIAVFGAREIHREAFQALAYFCSAARLEEVGISLIQEVSDFVKEVRTNPGLQFTPRTSLPC
jgi:tetratricopeptide (TPR) repeat protein